MSALSKLVEQTVFLLEKQREAREYTVAAFKDFLAAIEEAQQARAEKEEQETLQEIYDAIADQSERYAAEIDEDISYLDSQLETMEKITEEGNQAKEAELVRVLLGGEEVPDTETFKQEVGDEADAAKKHFFAVIDDLKNALEEENFDDLVSYVEQVEEGGSEGEEEGECCGNRYDCGDKCVCNDDCGCA